MSKIRDRNTLPRRTLLATFGSRYMAAIVDFVICFALTLGLYYGAFYFAFREGNNQKINQLNDYQISSHLFYRDDDGFPMYYEHDVNNPDYHIYENALTYYYLSYLTGEGIDINEAAPNCNEVIVLEDGEEVFPKDYYTIAWYNKTILGIGIDPDDVNDTGYFTYQKDSSGQYDQTKIGVAKEKHYDASSSSVLPISQLDLCVYYGNRYMEAYDNLTYQSFYLPVRLNLNFMQGISILIPILIAILITYLLFPLIFKQGQTLGKLIFKLGLCNSDGYALSRYRVIFRPIIAILLFLFVFLVTPNINLYLNVMILIVPLLISWVFTMASPKHSALHDYLSFTIVIDAKNSCIYKDPIEEEIELSKEENIEPDLKKFGEVPLSYDRKQYKK